MTPEARAAMGSRLLHWLPVRLRHKGRVLRCAGRCGLDIWTCHAMPGGRRGLGLLVGAWEG